MTSAGSTVPTSRPSRSTVIRSDSASTSRILWEMNTSPRPSSTICRRITKKSSTSFGVSTAVGSSRTSSEALRYSAFMISTRCRSPTESCQMYAGGSTRSPYVADSSSIRPDTGSRSVSGRRDDFMPSATFSATVSVDTSMKCWWIMPIPCRIAAAGDVIATGSPCSRISPSSGLYRPYSTRISVLLPAPFSPRSVCTSPARTSKSTRSLASTPGNRFVMPRISSMAVRRPPHRRFPGVVASTVF